MRSYYTELDSSAQETFNNLVEKEGLPDIVALLSELNVDIDTLRGAVAVWAFEQAGLI